MKKLLSVLAIAAMASTAHAQLWFGGSISISNNGGINKTSEYEHKTAANSSFSLAPMVGFGLNEKLSIGGMLNIETSTSKSFRYDADDKETTNKFVTNSVGVTPFVRYTFVEFNKFGLMAEAGLPIAYSSSKTVDGSETTKGDPTTSVGLYAVPMLTYGLNDHISLECALDFLSLNTTYNITTDRDDSSKSTVTRSFDFGVDSRTVATVGRIRIGFIYKL